MITKNKKKCYMTTYPKTIINIKKQYTKKHYIQGDSKYDRSIY